MPDIPQTGIALLGICDQARLLTNFHPSLQSLSILALRREVVGRTYPLPLKGLQLVFAMFSPSVGETVNIICHSEAKGQELFRFHMSFHVHGMDEGVEDLDSPLWIISTIPFTDAQKVLLAPDKLHFFVQDGENLIPIGYIHFLYAKPQPLTEQRISAIRSDPQAAKFARFELRCDSCGSKIRLYTGIERSPESEKLGYSWYEEAPDGFKCACGNLETDLHILKESFHYVLGERFMRFGEEFAFTRLYTKNTLEHILQEFEDLLASVPKEPSVQSFLQQNTILFHSYSPAQIIPKAPILTSTQSL